jgi:putative SOS response-associated peptidase YedK
MGRADDRMSVRFTREVEGDAWLHPDVAQVELRKMLVPADDDLIETVPVTRDLLRTKEPGAELLVPVGA